MSYANEHQNMAIDSIKADIVDLRMAVDSLNAKFASDKFVAFGELEKSREFYSSSFSDLLTTVGIAIAFLGIIMTIFIYILLEKFSLREIDKLKTKVKEEFSIIKNKSEKLSADQGGKHYDEAIKYLDKKEFSKHFFHMYYVFQSLRIRIDLLEYDSKKFLSDLKKYCEFKKEYKDCKKDIKEIVCSNNDKNEFSGFVKYLLDFMGHCEDCGKFEYIGIVKDMYNEFCNQFDYDKIKKRLEKYLKKEDPKNADKILRLAEKYRGIQVKQSWVNRAKQLWRNL